MFDNFVFQCNSLFFNLLPDDKIFTLFQPKTFADNISNIIQNNELVFHRIENLAEKGENATSFEINENNEYKIIPSESYACSTE